MKILAFIRQIKALVDLANDIRAEADRTGKPSYSLFLTNRSFIAAMIGVLAMLAALVAGFVLPIQPDELAEVVVTLSAAAITAFGWAGGERLAGGTRAIWNTTQAVKAVEEAAALKKVVDDGVKHDALTEALDAAGAPVAVQKVVKEG